MSLIDVTQVKLITNKCGTFLHYKLPFIKNRPLLIKGNRTNSCQILPGRREEGNYKLQILKSEF